MASIATAGAVVSVAQAQEPASSFAAGNLSDWNANVAGPARSRKATASPAATSDAKKATDPAAGAAPDKPKVKPATGAQAHKALPKAAKGMAAAGAQPGQQAPTPTFTPASMPRGPIVVRPPNQRGGTMAAGMLPPAPAPSVVTTAITPPPAPKLAPGDCLAVNQIGPGTYQIENAGCSNAAVLATIEIRNGSRSVTCYIARIRDAYAVTSPPGAPPRINHQCRDGAPGCTEPALKTMFPECRGSV